MNSHDLLMIAVPAVAAAIGAVVVFQILDRFVGPRFYKMTTTKKPGRSITNN